MTGTVTIPLTITVPANELADAVLGSGWDTFSWWLAAKYHGDNVDVVVVDPDTDKVRESKTITPDHLAQALTVAIEKGYTDACTGRPITVTRDLDFDACVGDVIMQIAVLGEVVYG